MSRRSTDRRDAALAAAVVLTLVTGLTAATASDAHGTTGPVTYGSGWKLQAPNIDHIDTRPWVIAFHDRTSMTRLTPYVRNTAAELSSYLGVKFTVLPLIVSATRGKCPPSHTITMRWMSKPDPDHPGWSFTGACGSGHAAYSAYTFINSDYWKAGSGVPEWQRMNVIWHELGHAVGLAHPATCPKDKTGKPPLMCTDTYNDLRLRRYSSFEATAFRQLVANRAYYPAATTPLP
ncbi:MAG: hypothetical protein HOV92_12870 [Streptomyces sp.]|nr:hypothetical protein [Streptomyces sp.]